MQNGFYQLIYKLQQFMSGRSGMDALNKALLITYFILRIVTSILYGSSISFLTKILSAAVLLRAVFRFLSKDVVLRRAENEKWLLLFSRIQRETGLMRERWNTRKIYYYKDCPDCNATIRVKRIKGKHIIDCPKCGREIKINIWF